MAQEVTEHEIENSEAIKRIQHDGYTLRVHFAAGSVYEYDDVSDAMVDNLVKAEFPSRYLVRHIMPDRERVHVSAESPFPRLAWN